MIPAGGSGKLTAKIKVSAGSTGTHAKSITVQTDAPQTPALRLSLAFTAVTPISATPNFRLYLNTVEGEPSSVRILLHRDDGEPLAAQIEKVSLTEGVKLSIEAVPDGSTPEGSGRGIAGDLWIVAETLDGSPPVNQNGVVVLTTNHPQAPTLEIPIYLRVRPVIEVQPNAVKLWPSSGGPNGTSTRIRLSHNLRQPFEVTGVEVSDPKLLTARVTSQAGQPIQAVELTLADPTAPIEGQVRASLRISTSVEGKERIEIPVVITTRHEALRRQPLPAVKPAKPTAPAGSGTS